MLYQPSFPNPYLSTIDANNYNTFRFKVNGDSASAYQLFIYNASTNELVYDTGKIGLNEDMVYGNDGDDSFIEIVVPPLKLKNGIDYVWKVKLWQPTHDIEVVRGRVYENAVGTSSLKIRPHIEDTVKPGMVLKIGTEEFVVDSCRLQYPKVYSSMNATEDGTIYISGDNGFAKDDYVTIGCFGYQSKKNTTTAVIEEISIVDGQTKIKFVGDSPSGTFKDITYIQKSSPSVYSTVIANRIFERDVINQGAEYVILSDFVECDVGFYFKARTSPKLTIYNNNNIIEDNAISNDNSSIDIKAIYEQEEGVNIKYWNIKLKSENRTLYSTGDVYNGKISFKYDSLLPQKYRLELFLENSDGVIIEDYIDIDVRYEAANAFLRPKAKILYDSAVEVSWTDLVNIYGKSNFPIENIGYDGNYITLNSGESILWDSVDSVNKLNMESPTIVSTVVTDINDYTGSILEVFDSCGEDKIEVGYDSKVFWWKVNNEYTYQYSPYTEQVYKVGISSGDIVDENKSNVLYLWDDSGNSTWSDSGNELWYYNDVGDMYWWLIQVDLYNNDYSKMVTFTKYKKH